MSLYCPIEDGICSDNEPEIGTTFYQDIVDCDTSKWKRSKRCQECKCLIKPGTKDCAKIDICKYENMDQIEDGDPAFVKWEYLCEECYGLVLSVQELGYCYNLPSIFPGTLREDIKELFPSL